MEVDSEKYLSINIHALHEECARQAELYHEHAVGLARAEKNLDQAKSDLKLVEAELDGDIRESPEIHGLKKVTDESVKMAILRNETHQRATKRVNSLKFQVGVHEADVKALEQKKSMLELEVKLRLADYFADPVLPKLDGAEVARMVKESTRSRGQA